jgi:hypothetical protein
VAAGQRGGERARLFRGYPSSKSSARRCRAARGCCSQTRNLVVGICPHTVGKRAGALAHVIPLRAGCPFCLARAAFPLPLGCATVLGQGTPQRGVYAQPSFGDGLDFPACEVAACGVASRVVEVSGGTPSGTKASVAPEGCKPCRALLGRDGCREPHCKGGAFIFADFKWPPGTIVTLTLQLESHPAPTTLVRTKVVRSVPDGLGVQFLCLSKAERQSLANFLKGIA